MFSKVFLVLEYCSTSTQSLIVCVDVSFLAFQAGFVCSWLNPNKDTMGALDLGGASTQITFETSETIESKENMMKLMLYGRTYTLYTHSFLCYGKDQFLKKLLAYQIQVVSTKE